IFVHIDVVIDAHLEIARQRPALFARVATDFLERDAHVVGRFSRRHPSVAKARDTPITGFHSALRCKLRIRNNPDRYRLLNRPWQDRDMLESIVSALIVDVFARGRQTHYLNRLFHPSHPALRLNAQSFELLVKCAASRLRLSLASDEYRTTAGHEIETC